MDPIVYIENLPATMPNKSLRELFANYGNVLRVYTRPSVKIPNSQIGLVFYDSFDSAKKAIEAMDHTPPLNLNVKMKDKKKANTTTINHNDKKQQGSAYKERPSLRPDNVLPDPVISDPLLPDLPLLAPLLPYQTIVSSLIKAPILLVPEEMSQGIQFVEKWVPVFSLENAQHAWGIDSNGTRSMSSLLDISLPDNLQADVKERSNTCDIKIKVESEHSTSVRSSRSKEEHNERDKQISEWVHNVQLSKGTECHKGRNTQEKSSNSSSTSSETKFDDNDLTILEDDDATTMSMIEKIVKEQVTASLKDIKNLPCCLCSREANVCEKINDLKESKPVEELPLTTVENLPKLEVGLKSEVILNAVRNFSCITVLPRNYVDEVITLMNSEPPNLDGNGVYLPRNKELVLAKNIKDCRWYRAEIINVAQNQARILFIDFGMENDVNLSDIRPIPPKPLKWPLFIVALKNDPGSLVPLENFLTSWITMTVIDNSSVPAIVTFQKNQCILAP